MKTCIKCHKPMYSSKHHVYCNDCWKASKKKHDTIPENKYGRPIFVDRNSKNKRGKMYGGK